MAKVAFDHVAEGQIRTGDEVASHHPPWQPRPDEQGDDAVVDRE